jgi:Zn finger protein HypA/HybF involved in hydrogenase expression
MGKIVHICPYCGSENISIDAAARWNVERQEWVLSGTMDSGGCDDCQQEFKRTDEKEVPDEG